METYRRRITAEEARAGRLFVEGARRGFFPPEGKPFKLDKRETRVETYSCTCKGGEPHEHAFVRVKGVKRLDEVEIERQADGLYRRTT